MAEPSFIVSLMHVVHNFVFNHSLFKLFKFLNSCVTEYYCEFRCFRYREIDIDIYYNGYTYNMNIHEDVFSYYE